MKYLIKIDSFSAEEESYEEGYTGEIYDDTWAVRRNSLLKTSKTFFVNYGEATP